MKDSQNRSYLTVEEATATLEITVDSDFTCAVPGQKYKLQDEDEGLYFECDDGRHYLNGQLSDDETYYVGVYPA